MKGRTRDAPWGQAYLPEKTAHVIHKANAVTREVLAILHVAADSNVPFFACHRLPPDRRAEGFACWERPETKHIAKHPSFSSSTAMHRQLGTVKTIANARVALDDAPTKYASAHDFDAAATALLDEVIIARWCLRVSRATPDSHRHLAGDAYDATAGLEDSPGEAEGSSSSRQGGPGAAEGSTETLRRKEDSPGAAVGPSAASGSRTALRGRRVPAAPRRKEGGPGVAGGSSAAGERTRPPSS